MNPVFLCMQLNDARRRYRALTRLAGFVEKRREAKTECARLVEQLKAMKCR